MRRIRPLFFVLCLAVMIAGSAYAGPYTNDLSKCLVESTSQEDRVDLVVWMFSAAAAHPAVEHLVTVSEEELNDANRTMGELIMRLLTESCVEQYRKAVKYEGAAVIEASFEVLGQVAGQELFARPEVVAAMSSMQEAIDEEKLQSVLEEE